MPQSARMALAGLPNSAAASASMRSAILASPVARTVDYSVSLKDYQCPTGAILAAYRQAQAALALELRSSRGFHDGTAAASSARAGKLLAVADSGTIRRRAAVARLKEVAMRWWLLLHEEYERTAGLVGLGPGEGRDTFVELRRVIAEEPFVSLASAHPAAANGDANAAKDVDSVHSRGILDDDGFNCPHIGIPAVSAHGLRLELSDFARRATAGLIEIVRAFFPPSTNGGNSLPQTWRPPDSHLLARQAQAKFCELLSSEWCFDEADIHLGPRGVLPFAKGQRVVMARPPLSPVGKCVGSILVDDSGRIAVKWDLPAGAALEKAGASKNAKSVFRYQAHSRTSSQRSSKSSIESRQSDVEDVDGLDLCLAPIRLDVLERIYLFVLGRDLEKDQVASRDSESRAEIHTQSVPEPRGSHILESTIGKCSAPLVLLIAGPSGSGRSVCIARFLKQWFDDPSSASGQPSASGSSSGHRAGDCRQSTPLVSYYLHGGDCDDDNGLVLALEYLANDIILQSRSNPSGEVFAAAEVADRIDQERLFGTKTGLKGSDDVLHASSDSSGSNLATRLAVARQRFASAAVYAIVTNNAKSAKAGDGSAQQSIVVFVDGLRSVDVVEFVRLVYSLDKDVLRGLGRVMPMRAGAPTIRAVLTCRVSPEISKLIEDEKRIAKILELGQLSLAEREAVARNWIFRQAGRIDPPEGLLRIITEKSAAASSPLYIAAICHMAAPFFSSSGDGTGLQAGTCNIEEDPTYVHETRLREMPDGLERLFATGLLQKLEVLHGQRLVAEVDCMTACNIVSNSFVMKMAHLILSIHIESSELTLMTADSASADRLSAFRYSTCRAEANNTFERFRWSRCRFRRCSTCSRHGTRGCTERAYTLVGPPFQESMRQPSQIRACSDTSGCPTSLRYFMGP